jgi:hypothetical protein
MPACAIELQRCSIRELVDQRSVTVCPANETTRLRDALRAAPE